MDYQVDEVCASASHPIIVIMAENEFLVVEGGIMICQLKNVTWGEALLLWICSYYCFCLRYPSESQHSTMASMLMLLQMIILEHTRVKGSRPKHFRTLHQHITTFMGVSDII